MEGFDFRGDYRDEDHLQDYEPAANESPKCDKRDLLVSSILRYSRCDFQDLCTPGSPGSSSNRFLLQSPGGCARESSAPFDCRTRWSHVDPNSVASDTN